MSIVESLKRMLGEGHSLSDNFSNNRKDNFNGYLTFYKVYCSQSNACRSTFDFWFTSGTWNLTMNPKKPNFWIWIQSQTFNLPRWPKPLQILFVSVKVNDFLIPQQPTKSSDLDEKCRHFNPFLFLLCHKPSNKKIHKQNGSTNRLKTIKRFRFKVVKKKAINYQQQVHHPWQKCSMKMKRYQPSPTQIDIKTRRTQHQMSQADWK